MLFPIHGTPRERKQALIDSIARVGLVRWSDELIRFKSGITSHVYVSGREELTSDAGTLFAVGMAIATAAFMAMPEANLNERKKLVLIGIPTAGTPLAVAAALAWHTLASDIRIGSRTMRDARKEHGRPENRRFVDGAPREDEIYYTVDNVITDGASKLTAIRRLCEDGYYPAAGLSHIILIDRKQGGVEMLRAQGHRVITLLGLPTIVKTLVARGAWPKERLVAYERELRA